MTGAPPPPAAWAPRPAEAADFPALAVLWLDQWTRAHLAHVPPDLAALRTEADFLRRLKGFGDGLRVIGPPGAPLGFCVVLGDHLDQIYVAPELQGTGAAEVLMRHAEARLRQAGHRRALLECNPGNARAAAFYDRMGWRRRGTETVLLDSSAGPFAFDCLIFERDLA